MNISIPATRTTLYKRRATLSADSDGVRHASGYLVELHAYEVKGEATVFVIEHGEWFEENYSPAKTIIDGNQWEAVELAVKEFRRLSESHTAFVATMIENIQAESGA